MEVLQTSREVFRTDTRIPQQYCRLRSRLTQLLRRRLLSFAVSLTSARTVACRAASVALRDKLSAFPEWNEGQPTDDHHNPDSDQGEPEEPQRLSPQPRPVHNRLATSAVTPAPPLTRGHKL